MKVLDRVDNKGALVDPVAYHTLVKGIWDGDDAGDGQRLDPLQSSNVQCCDCWV